MFEIICAVIIPFVVQLLKKIKLPSRVAPIAAVILAILAVAGAKLFGIDLNIQSTLEAILKVLGISGMSILGYDVLKKTINNK